MTYMLVIQTALDEGFVCLAANGSVIGEKKCLERKDQAAFLHPAIQSLLEEAHLKPGRLDAIAVVSGPGSYTGLRIGMACAKGLCFALSIPLVTLNTLDWMAAAAPPDGKSGSCPMIDARRMEVFTARYDAHGLRMEDPRALILSPDAFAEALRQHPIRFFGSGAEKWKALCPHPNAWFPDIRPKAITASQMAWSHWQQSAFADLAYAAPFYGKEFHSTLKPHPLP